MIVFGVPATKVQRDDEIARQFQRLELGGNGCIGDAPIGVAADQPGRLCKNQSAMEPALRFGNIRRRKT
jgi:hypothetical protein